jgi:hypothetical protein
MRNQKVSTKNREQKSGFLINVARGGIVDDAALAEELKLGTIAGAGLDVFVVKGGGGGVVFLTRFVSVLKESPKFVLLCLM